MCEDFPCCGHEAGCCPDYDEAGKQLNMKCTCGKKLPVNSRFSICHSCIRSDDDDGYNGGKYEEDDLAEYNRNEEADYRDE